MLEKNDIIGDYTLAEFLGKGQFGEVWLGEKKLQFGSRKFRHALKFLSNIANEIDFKNAEAEVDTWIEASGHPNVMLVLDMLIHKEHIIIVSEFAENGSLKKWLDQNNKKAPSNEKAVEMMRGILLGIEHLHSRNIVHRDLKPDNILLQGNFPRLADFGISRIILENSALTKAMGSPAYMSPESFLGNKSPQTDIWSAGVILYEMLTGKYPFGGETIYALIDSIGKNAPLPLPENIPLQLQEVIYKALEKDRSNRYQTAGEMNEALKNVWVSVENEARRKREWEIEQERVKTEVERASLQRQLEESEKSVIEERRKREEAEQKQREELERTQHYLQNKREENSSDASPVETIKADFAARIRQRELEEKRRQERERKESEKKGIVGKIAVGIGGLLFSIVLIATLYFVWLKNNTAEAMSYYNLGESSFKQGNYDSAIENYSKTIKLNSQNSAAYKGRGDAYTYKKDYDSAIWDYNKAIELESQNTNAYISRANAYKNKQDYDSAIRDYTKVITLNPQSIVAYSGRANACYYKKDYDSAIQDYTKIIEFNPQDVTYYNRGIAYFDKKDFKAAIRDYTEAIKLNVKYIKAYESRADAYDAIGQKDLADADRKKAYDISIGL